MIAVRVPASTANLGPGFDALGLALSLDAQLGTAGDGVPDGATVVDERHPADVAFRRGGGTGPLWVRSPIPSGRGVGFSGAMRIGGLAVAVAQAPDLMLLDEPTNHLSPALAGEIEEALGVSPGAVVVASHDRWLRRRWSGSVRALG